MISNVNQIMTKTQENFLFYDTKVLSHIDGCVLGIDYGTVRIGLAISDKNKQIATPFKTIYQLRELDDIVPAKEISAFVVGLPLQTDGREGDIAKQVRLFVNRLIEKYERPVILTDERYTSKYAAEYMTGHGTRIKKQQKQIDSVAAARILQKALNQYWATK